MSKYTARDFYRQVMLYTNTFSTLPVNITLPVQDYIELLQDGHSTAPLVSLPTAPPAFESYVLFGVRAIPVDRSGCTYPTWYDVLTTYGQIYAASNPISHLGGYMQLDIGPWRYAVPLPRTSSFPKITGAHAAPLIQPLLYEGIIGDPSQLTPPAAQEPPCLCSSRSLVTIGHEQGCRWLLWKSSGGAK